MLPLALNSCGSAANRGQRLLANLLLITPVLTGISEKLMAIPAGV